MPAQSDLLLHTLRCIGHVDVSRLAAATGMPEPDVESELIDLAVEGLVTRQSGPFRAWGLTETGRATDAERTTAELDAAGARATITQAYQDFLVLNPELLDLCTAWQLRPVDGIPVQNDHTDTGYDGRVLIRLADLDHRADAVLAALSGALPRFARYRERLTEALTRAGSGSLEYVTDHLESYHTVWFQLHEDLLATLGLSRASGS